MLDSLLYLVIGLGIFTRSSAAVPGHAKVHRGLAERGVAGSAYTVSNVLNKASADHLNDINMMGPALWDGTLRVGTGGPYVMEFHNNAGEDLTLIGWQPKEIAGQFGPMMGHQPTIAYTLPSNGVVSISMAAGVSGGFQAVFQDTRMDSYRKGQDMYTDILWPNPSGQVYETWVEYTSGGYVDASFLINPNGRDVKINTATCLSDRQYCSFVCNTPSTGLRCPDYGSGPGQHGDVQGKKGDTCYIGDNNGGCDGWSPTSKVTVGFT